MKKSSTIIIVIIAVIVIGGGAFALMHKSSNNSSSKGTTTTSTKAPAVNNAVIVTKTDATVGQYLADTSGNALYTYGGDKSEVSNCTGACLNVWPAYVDAGATTDLPTGVSTITRTDNSQVQFTYNGMPLYTFANDSAGKVTGNGINNFSVAKP